MRQLIKGEELQTIPKSEQQFLESVAVEIQDNMEGQPEHPRNIRRVLSLVSQNVGESLVLLDKSDERLFHNGPRISFPFQQRFKNLSQADSSYGFMMGSRVFFGPVDVTFNNKHYALFKGKRALFPMLRHQGEWLILAVLTISGLLCFFLAWTFTRPIKELRDVAQKMAQGNIQAGTNQIIRRRDEIGELSEDFRTMAVKVNELLEHQKRLLADISHELRSPLARLQLAIGIAQQDLESSKALTESSDGRKIHYQVLERIEKEAIQIDNMIARVLQLSRLESNTQDIIRHKVNFPSFISNVMQDAQYEAKSLGKNLVQEHFPGTEIVVEPTLVASAIENVLRNGIRYAKTTITVQSEVQDGHLIIAISDDGCGVPESDLDKLFTPFYRVSLARNRGTGGTGLGLAIAIQAINAHNGDIRAFNNNKGGLSVEIKLPLLDS